MQLSKNFNLDEFTISQTASRLGIDNTPGLETVSNLKYVAENLEIVRGILGVPILISSGYRAPAVNKAVGGSLTSQHMTGKAVDFTAPSFGTPLDIVNRLSTLAEFDQMILEFNKWVHISFTKNQPRKQILVTDNFGTRAFVKPKDKAWQEVAAKDHATVTTMKKNPLLELLNSILSIFSKK